MRISLHLIFILVYFITFTCVDICNGQVFTANDGFEGPPLQGIPPPNWYNCDGNSTVDTQPGIFHNFLPATQGQSYVSMVTRLYFPAGTVETVWADLLVPFEINKCYSLSFDLSLSHDFYASTWDADYYFERPCVLQIIGFNGNCNAPLDSELLWQSGELNNFFWQTFDILIHPDSGSYDRIAIRPMFTPPANHQFSVVFVDNIRFESVPFILTCVNDYIMLPDGAEGIKWYINNQEIPGTEQTEVLLPSAPGDYLATFYDSNNCFATGEVTITSDGQCVETIESSVDFYNVITPNGDLLNDEFLITGTNINKIKLKIFNRWGTEVFSTDDKNVTWKGNDRNEECPEGVYFYLAIVEFYDGRTVQKQGHVSLFR